MAVVNTSFNCDLFEPVQIHNIPNYFNSDNNGNRITAIVTRNGEPVTLSGTVKGYAVRSDGSTVTFNGTRSGNTAYINIPTSALMQGALFITLTLIDGIETTTLAAISTYVM